MNTQRWHWPNRFFMVGPLLIGLLFAAPPVTAGERFSFLVTGDSRTEAFLPYGVQDRRRIRDILEFRYGHQRLQLDYGADGMLHQVLIGAPGAGRLTVDYRNGWPENIFKTSTDAAGRLRERRIMARKGRQWVFDSIVGDLQPGAGSGGPAFVVHGGDITLNGYQGRSLAKSPFWQLFNTQLLQRLPPVDPALGLPGRVLAAVGNHELCDDPELEGMLTSLPWLRQLGLTTENRIYAVKYRRSRFVFLDSGSSCWGRTCWNSDRPDFSAQMAFLQEQLQEAREHHEQHVFVVYHKPSFVGVGHDPLPETQNPHRVLRKFSEDLNIVVFNSHAHTTEHYLVDGVRYLVIGGGGAPQAFGAARHPSPQRELYWNGAPRLEEYNYLRVDVDGPRLRVTLHRNRLDADPEWVSMFEVSGTPAIGNVSFSH